MSSDAKNCVGFSVVKLEPHKHVLKPGGLGWFRKICCLRDNCGETGRVSFKFSKCRGKKMQKTSNKSYEEKSMFVCISHMGVL